MRRWTKIILSGLSGALLGLGAVLLRRRRAQPALPEPIPNPVQELRLRTEPLPITFREQPYESWAEYRCLATKFRVWSVLGTEAGGGQVSQSRRIFHVRPVIHFRSLLAPDQVETVSEEPFYATLYVDSQRGEQQLAEQLARGRHLEFRRCHVGGSLNGVETGERLLTPSPLQDYEILAEKQ